MKFSTVGVKNSSGGWAIACNSVLNAVNINQPRGKNNNSVIAQATRLRMIKPSGNGFARLGACCGVDAMSFVQVLAHQADQKDSCDIGQHYRKQRTG